jgi:hypothetical protein
MNYKAQKVKCEIGHITQRYKTLNINPTLFNLKHSSNTLDYCSKQLLDESFFQTDIANTIESFKGSIKYR